MGTTGAALKRSAVAHLANLKRARVDDDSLRRPAKEVFISFFFFRFLFFSFHFSVFFITGLWFLAHDCGSSVSSQSV